ncbi:MAG: cupin domain-containing protein [Chloroflexi bacterium]|nr:cupin domain-containing protein [Chloroflexota bacterium]
MQVFPATSIEAKPAPDAAGVALRWVIAQNVGAPNFYMRVIEVQAGAATEKHSHAWEHEVYVLEGSGSVNGVQGKFALEAGDCVYVAPNELHQFANTGQVLLRFICVIPRL